MTPADRKLLTEVLLPQTDEQLLTQARAILKQIAVDLTKPGADREKLLALQAACHRTIHKLRGGA